MDFNFEFDITVIGAGPAGLTAAIYAKRANLSVCFIDKGAPGGKVTTTSFVENYPGFEYITGPDLAFKWYEQVMKLNIKHIGGEVIDINTKIDNYKYVILKNKKVIKSKTVIIATGMVNRLLNIPGESKYEHKGISYCCICDGAIYKDKIVSIIGSGRSSVEEATYMSDIAKKVYVISNKNQFKAEQGIVNNLLTKKNVEILYNTNTLEFQGDDSKLTNLLLQNQIDNKIFKLDVNGSFTFIGFLPISPTVNGESILDKNTNFITVNNEMMTTVPGIFAAGDIVTKSIRQITTAVGDGAIAALGAVDYVGKRQWKN